MQRKVTKFITSFQASGDDGKQYTVNEYRDYTHTKALAGNEEVLAGLSSFKLEDGRRVVARGESGFELLESGKALRRL